MGILIAPVAVGLIYGLGAILAYIVFHTPREPVPAYAGVPGATNTGSSVTVAYSGLHRVADGVRGRRGHAGVHRS